MGKRKCTGNGMLMEMAEDGYVFCIEDGKIQAVEVRIFS